MDSVYLFDDYKAWMQALLKQSPQRGLRSAWCRAMQCPPSFLSQVLNGPVHLSMDHAIRLTQHWRLSTDEEEQFLDLVSLARAGSPQLRQHLLRKLKQRRKKAENLSHRFQKPSIQEGEQQWLYYSNWYMAAIHLLAYIPQYQSPRALSQKLALPIEQVQEALEKLQAMGLVQKNQQHWIGLAQNIHLSKDAPASPVNHLVWRQKAMDRIFNAPAKTRERNLHYTALHTLHRQDIPRLRQKLVEAIEEMRSVAEDTQEEELVCFTC